MTDYTNLIARLEAAEGPSRELDAEIFETIGAKPSTVADPITGTETFWTYEGKTGFPPRFTASLDAAVSLVPDGWLWSVTDSMRGRANVHKPSALKETPPPVTKAPTPALALCIAALKARDTNERQ